MTSMKFLTISTALIFLLCHVKSEETRKLAVCDMDDPESYLDQLIEEILQKIPSPLPLPDREGFINLSEGEIRGLENLKRKGPADIICNPDLEIIILHLESTYVRGNYNYQKSLITKEVKGNVYVRADEFEVLVQLSKARKTGAKLTVDVLDITNVNGINVHFNTDDLMKNWPLSVLVSTVANIFRTALGNLVEGPLKEAIQNKLHKMELHTKQAQNSHK